MRLSFSTRGWAEFDFDELIDIAEEMKFQGVEMYNVPDNELLCGKGKAFHSYNAQASARHLKERKIEIPCFDSSYDISVDDWKEQEIGELMNIAAATKVPYICLVAHYDRDDLIRERLTKLLAEAKEKDICILIKTSGIYADTARLRSVMDEFASDHLAALWDVHHPYRDFNESADDTIKNLGAYVKHVHLRDSSDKDNYELIGEGTFPVDTVITALDSIDYPGFISLEWKTQWLKELDDYQVIFPHFVTYMSRFDSTRGKRVTYYPNHDGTGHYLWKKDELIDLTFPQVLDAVADAFPDQYCFKYTTLDYTRTYEEFREDVDHFARALISMGVRAGSKVTIWATNVPAWYITFWATTKIGAVLVTMNTAYKIHEAEYLLRQSDTHTLVMIENALDSDYREIINELCPEIKDAKPGEALHCKRLPFLRNVITAGFKMPGCLTLEEAMDRYNDVPQQTLLDMASKVRPGDVCNMQYTSGTTGFPKGVMLTHYNVVNNGKCIGDRM